MLLNLASRHLRENVTDPLTMVVEETMIPFERLASHVTLRDSRDAASTVDSLWPAGIS